MAWFAKEKMILSKNIITKEGGLSKYKQKLSDVCDGALFANEKGKDGKPFMNVHLPDPFGFAFVIEDGKISILDKLSEEQMQQMAHLFHMLGINDFRFSYGSKKDNKVFCEKFQEIWNDEFNEGIDYPPKYETKNHEVLAGSSHLANDPIEKVDKGMKSWISRTGKKVGRDVVRTKHFDGSISYKFYPDEKARKTSGKIGKDGSVGSQNDEFYAKVTPAKKDGSRGTSVEFFGKKPITDGQANELVGILKSTGAKKFRFGPNLLDDDKVALIMACARKQIIPIFTPEVPIYYEKFLEAIDAEVKPPKRKMSIADKLETTERMFEQMKQNTARNSGGNTIPSNDGLQQMYHQFEYRILEGNMQKGKNSELKTLSKYTGDNIKNIVKLIDDHTGVDYNKKLKFKEDLLTSVKAYASNLSTDDVDNSVTEWVTKLTIQKGFSDIYTNKFQSMIETAMHGGIDRNTGETITGGDARDIYATTTAAALVMKEYLSHLEDPAKRDDPFNFDESFLNNKNECEIKYETKMHGDLSIRSREEAIKRMNTDASKMLSGVFRKYEIYGVSRASIDIIQGEYTHQDIPSRRTPRAPTPRIEGARSATRSGASPSMAPAVHPRRSAQRTMTRSTSITR